MQSTMQIVLNKRTVGVDYMFVQCLEHVDGAYISLQCSPLKCTLIITLNSTEPKIVKTIPDSMLFSHCHQISTEHYFTPCALQPYKASQALSTESKIYPKVGDTQFLSKTWLKFFHSKFRVCNWGRKCTCHCSVSKLQKRLYNEDSVGLLHDLTKERFRQWAVDFTPLWWGQCRCQYAGNRSCCLLHHSGINWALGTFNNPIKLSEVNFLTRTTFNRRHTDEIGWRRHYTLPEPVCTPHEDHLFDRDTLGLWQEETWMVDRHTSAWLKGIGAITGRSREGCDKSVHFRCNTRFLEVSHLKLVLWTLKRADNTCWWVEV